MADTSNGFDNQLTVAGRVLSGAPQAIMDEIVNDWKNDKRGLALRVGVSAGLGAAAEVLLSKAPVAAMAALGVWVGVRWGFEAVEHYGGARQFLANAWDANTIDEQNQAVKQGLAGIAPGGAYLAETTGGLLAGTVIGKGMSKYLLDDQPAFWMTRKVEIPLRTKMPEGIHFFGPGAMRLPKDALSGEGKVNLLSIADSVKEPWKGVERARSIDLSRGKISRALSGTRTDVDLGFPDKPGRIIFHTHGDAVGPRPGLFDAAGTQDMGIIQNGNKTTFYVGQAREFEAALKGIELPKATPNELARSLGEGKINMRALVLDNTANAQRAYLLDTPWSGESLSWQPSVPTYVDYSQARNLLRAFDLKNPVQQLQSLRLLAPGETPPLAEEDIRAMVGAMVQKR